MQTEHRALHSKNPAREKSVFCTAPLVNSQALVKPLCLEEAKVHHNLGGKVNLSLVPQKSRIINQIASPAKFHFQKPGGAVSTQVLLASSNIH